MQWAQIQGTQGHMESNAPSPKPAQVQSAHDRLCKDLGPEDEIIQRNDNECYPAD